MSAADLIAAAPKSVRECTKASAPLFSLAGRRVAAKLYQVYDLDSFYAALELDGRLCSFKCRLRHVDSPELRAHDATEKKLAYEARDRARELIDGRVCCLDCGEFDKYGRVLVEVTLADGTRLHEWALREHLALPYEGGTKCRDWAQLRAARDALLRRRKM